MLLRVTNKKTGIIDYLVNGKASKGLHRNEYDDRKVVAGDMKALADDLSWCESNRNWKTNYKHWTLSFSEDDAKKLEKLDKLGQDKLYHELVEDTLKLHYPHLDPSELVYSAELHIPKEPHLFDEKGNKRLPHIHLVVSGRDPRTDNKLVCIHKNDNLMSAMQSKLNRKFNFQDPAYIADYNKENNIKRSEGIETKMKSLRNEVSDYINDKKPRSADELVKHIQKLKPTATIEATGSASKGNRYLKIVIPPEKEGEKKQTLNLRGRGFEALTPLYDQYRTTSKSKKDQEKAFKEFKDKFMTDKRKPEGLFAGNKAQKKRREIDDSLKLKPSRSAIASDPKLMDDIIKEHTDKFLNTNPNKELSLEDTKLREGHYKKTLNDIGETFETISKQQRVFFAIYSTNIDKEYIGDGIFFRPRNNPSVVVYTSKSLQVKITDEGDKLCLSGENLSGERLAKSMKIIVEQGLAKGWDLDTIAFITPVPLEYKKALEEEKQRRRDINKLKEEIPEILQKNEHIIKHARAITSINDTIEELAKARENNKASELCKQLKVQSNSNTIRIMLDKKYSKDPDFKFDRSKFSMQRKNNELRIIEDLGDDKTRSWTPIDFAHKKLEYSINDAVNLLEETVNEQLQEKRAQEEALQKEIESQIQKEYETAMKNRNNPTPEPSAPESKQEPEPEPSTPAPAPAPAPRKMKF